MATDAGEVVWWSIRGDVYVSVWNAFTVALEALEILAAQGESPDHPERALATLVAKTCRSMLPSDLPSMTPMASGVTIFPLPEARHAVG